MICALTSHILKDATPLLSETVSAKFLTLVSLPRPPSTAKKRKLFSGTSVGDPAEESSDSASYAKMPRLARSGCLPILLSIQTVWHLPFLADRLGTSCGQLLLLHPLLGNQLPKLMQQPLEVASSIFWLGKLKMTLPPSRKGIGPTLG